MTNFVCKRNSFHFFFEMLKYEVNSSQTSEENSNKNLNESVWKNDDIHRQMNFSAINSEDDDEIEFNLFMLSLIS